MKSWMTVTEETSANMGRGMDRLNAATLERAGNTVSGLCLEEIGEDGHLIANKLWKIAAYLRRRSEAPSREVTPQESPSTRKRAGDES